MMNQETSDTRVTAYVFGELPPDESAAFEADLKNSEALQAEVQATREAIEVVRESLSAEDVGLDKASRQKVQAMIDAPKVDLSKPSSKRKLWISMAVAASLLLMVGWVLLPSVQVAREAAVRTAAIEIDRENMQQIRSSAEHHPNEYADYPVALSDSPNEESLHEFSLESVEDESKLVDELSTAKPKPMEPSTVAIAEITEELVRLPEPSAPGASLLKGDRDKLRKKRGGNVKLPAAAPISDQPRKSRLNKGLITKLGGVQAAEVQLDSGIISSGSHGLGPGRAGDRHDPIEDNPFRKVSADPLSTFSIDVDTASYAKVRMYLMQQNRFPRPDAVRIEELINYFDYDYQAPAAGDEHPFSAAMEVAECPWNPNHRLARIGIQGREIEEDRPASNLVFLLDVSGSMNQPNKLPLVVEGMKMLTDQLTENDSVAIVVLCRCRGKVVLAPTTGDKKPKDSLNRSESIEGRW